MSDPRPFVSPHGQVVRHEIWGEPVFFTITARQDHIQKQHLRGRFYEEEELAIIRQYCPLGAVFCDIGANVGNHTLFALKFLHARQAIVFEPNPAAIEVLRSNIMLNGLSARCDMSHLGLGLGDAESEGLAIRAPEGNLGGGQLVEGEGDIRVIRGDAALKGVAVDFIKIDVEGMELRTLAGLRHTIARCRPRLFVEVNQANRPGFMRWVKANGYEIATHFRRYPGVRNFLLVPAAAVAAEPAAAPAHATDAPRPEIRMDER